jgi:hypothetical protein
MNTKILECKNKKRVKTTDTVMVIIATNGNEF